jgi:D-xylose 1-dehydrogenase (NADP+, D-xylono-1,5-lactone-forming)
MTSDGTVRWGVLSTARIGRNAVGPAIAASATGTLHAVVSRDEARARRYADDLRVARAYGSYEALLDDPEVDAVYVPLPNSLHAEWTIRALERGKHVLCEKPLAMTAEQCERMDAAAKAHERVLMEAFMYRFHPRSERLFELVHGGAVGEVRYLQTAFSFTVTDPGNIRLDRALGGGALMDVGCYCVNVARSVLGAEPGEVEAFARWAPGDVDEQLTGTLRFGDGRVAQIACSLRAARSEEVLVVGSEGTVRTSRSFVPGRLPVELVLERPKTGPEAVRFDPVDQYQRMVEHFETCVLQGREPRYGAREAAANMRVIEALYRSARLEGRSVVVAEG